MDWHELVNDALPPPRGDEPRSLRQNIADELADHFACALRREQLRLGDEDAARRAALDTFGDPKWLAYRLWFDAMKETIMKDRMMMASTVLVAIACVGLVVLTWQMVESQRTFASEMMTRMETLTGGQQASQLPFEWGRLRVRVTTPHQGIAQEDVTVKLEGDIYGSGESNQLQKRPNENGIVDFGFVRVGAHDVGVRSPEATWSRRITVPPQSDQVIEVTFPDLSPVSVEVEMDWPESWKGHELIMGVVTKVVETPMPRWRVENELGGGFWSVEQGVVLPDAWGRMHHGRPESWAGLMAAAQKGFALRERAVYRVRGYYVQRQVARSDEGSTVDYDLETIAKHYFEDDETQNALRLSTLPDDTHVWRIELPEQLIAEVNKHLATKPTE